jgi:hypothetical protein
MTPQEQERRAHIEAKKILDYYRQTEDANYRGKPQNEVDKEMARKVLNDYQATQKDRENTYKDVAMKMHVAGYHEKDISKAMAKSPHFEQGKSPAEKERHAEQVTEKAKHAILDNKEKFYEEGKVGKVISDRQQNNIKNGQQPEKRLQQLRIDTKCDYERNQQIRQSVQQIQQKPQEQERER